MTLAEILAAVRQLTPPEKLELMRLLAEDLGAREEIRPFEARMVYQQPPILLRSKPQSVSQKNWQVARGERRRGEEERE